MQHFDRSSPLKDDIRSRTLRSSSPAVKRPASDMGGQDREPDGDNKDVEMQDEIAGSSPNTLTQSNGKRQKSVSTNLNVSNPGPVSQTAPSEESSISDNTNSSTSAASTAPTSTMETADPSLLPSIDEQIAKVIGLIQETPQDKQKGFCVSGKWLRRVQARGSEPPPGIEKAAMEGEIGPVDNTDITMVTEDSGWLKDEAGELFAPLRPGLQVGDEMQILPQAAWDLIVQWYGVAKESPIITRYAHALSEDNPLDVQYELNPPVFSFLKVVGRHTPRNEKDADLPPPRMVSSVHTSFMKWLKDAKELVHTDIHTKVRVWKVLGGLKSTSASGILTPAASRSASPAPGAEIIASAGSKMIIDVQSFGLLSIGDQRELVEHKDQTMNANYNGKVDLRTIGMGRGDVIVLEEQTAEEDKYPSDSPKFSFKGAAKAKNLTVTASGRSSPAPGMMTRGRAQKEGRPKGITGLQNLGNTCYMNSALQSLRSVNELTEYFRSGYYKQEINFDNVLGHKGEVARAYGNFIDGVYSGSSGVYNPKSFKNTIGRYGPSFAGYGQQDSQEFLAFLLDGLQEDLNRIHKKPYIEKPDSTDEMVSNEKLLKEFADRNWDDYKARNDSVVTDLFAGMYKSTLTCPECDKVSIVFDPFNTLTLQLPIENNWSKEIVYFPLFGRPVRVDVDIDKNATFLDMKKFIGQRTEYDPQKMICAESYKNKFFKTFDNTETIAEANINASDIICVYELAEKPTNYNPDKKKKYSQFSMSSKDTDPKVDADSPAADQLIVPLYHRVTRANGNNRIIRTFFGHPSYIVLSRNDRQEYDGVFKKVLSQVVGMTTIDIVQHHDFDGADATPEDSDTSLVPDGSTSSESPSASATSVQGEDGLVDVSMHDTTQATEQPNFDAPDSAINKLLQTGVAVPSKLHQLFEIKVAHTDDGIPTGWNSFNDNVDYIPLREIVTKQKSHLHRPKRSTVDDDDADATSADELAGVESTSRRKSQDSCSEAGASPSQTSDAESIELPETHEIISGKDTRGASKHQKKKTYSRKGKRTAGKALARRSPAVPPQPKIAATLSGNEIVLPGDAIILDWSETGYDALFEGDGEGTDDFKGALTHRSLRLFPDEALAAKRAERLNRKKTGVSLEDCLNEYGKTETLSEQNAWYCPRCKEHRRADKRFELWKVPDILVMHLKRFSSSRNFRDKLELKVEYPVEDLDLSGMVRDQSDGKSLTYDLIAVDNHYGGLGGGHYTAMAKNSVNGNWYDYNDSHVSQVKDLESVVTRSAYLLFYRRRTDPEHPLGGPKLEEILTEADSEQPTQSRDASPSGEGQRLGGYSHNGLSSASVLADQAHHVGDGGSAITNQQKMKGLSQDQEGGGHSIFHGHLSSSDAPTAYDDIKDDMLLDDEGIVMEHGPVVPPAWLNGNEWSFVNTGSGAPPSSNVDDAEVNDANQQMFGGLPQQTSFAGSNANASSTAGMGGSQVGNVSDLGDVDVTDEILHSFDDSEKQPILSRTWSDRDIRESAPPPENDTRKIIEIPMHNEKSDDEDDLEVQELRIEDADKS